MGELITRDEAKTQARVDGTDEDSLIDIYIGAAKEFIENVIDGPIPGITDPDGVIPFSLRAAALLIVADLYENRQSQTDKDLKENKAVMRLLHFYRDNMGI